MFIVSCECPTKLYTIKYLTYMHIRFFLLVTVILPFLESTPAHGYPNGQQTLFFLIHTTYKLSYVVTIVLYAPVYISAI